MVFGDLGLLCLVRGFERLGRANYDMQRGENM